MSNKICYDFAVLGGGLYGMRMANLIKNKFPTYKVVLIEKKKRYDVSTDQQNYVPLESGYNYLKNSKKYNYVQSGKLEILKYLNDNEVQYSYQNHFVFARHKMQKQRMKQLIIDNSPLITEITEEELIKQEHFFENKNLQDINIYSVGQSLVLDLNVLRAQMIKSMITSKIDMVFNTKIDKITTLSNKDFEIKGVNLRENQAHNIDCKFIVNCTGYTALDFSHQLNMKKEWSSAKIVYKYFKSKNERDQFPNCIITTPAFNVTPGFTCISTKGESAFGPIYKFKDPILENSSLLKSLLTLPHMIKFYKILHLSANNTYQPDIEYANNGEDKLIQNLKEVAHLNISKLGLVETKEISSILYSKKENKIVNDFVIQKEHNSLHFLNFNIFGGLNSFLPACEDAIKLI